MSSPRPGEMVIAFSRYTLTQNPPRLVADDSPVELGARALELLLALVEAGGRPVARAELCRRGWPDLAVDANTVQAQISTLRRALGDDRDLIVTVPGFGYRFAAEVHTGSAPRPSEATGPALQPPTEPPIHIPPRTAQTSPRTMRLRTPLHLTPFIGRHAELSEVLGLASIARVITLVGATGTGKSRIAHEAARRLAAQFPDGVVPVSLAAQTPREGFADAFALALNLAPPLARASFERLLDGVRTRRVLFVVDCGATGGEPAARMIAALLAEAPEVRAIVTAAAPLGLDGEEVVTLYPLRTPDDTQVSTALAAEHDALRLLFARLGTLFARRARLREKPRALARWTGSAALLAALDAGEISQDVIDAAVRIAQQLDGVPLALELAAASIDDSMNAGETLDTAMTGYARRLAGLIDARIDAPGVPRSLSAPVPVALDLHIARLDPFARKHFLLLSLFAGEFPRCAAIGLLTACELPMSASEGGGVRGEALADRRLDEFVEAGLIEEIDSDGQWMLQMRRPIRELARDMLTDSGEFDRAALAHAGGLPIRIAAHRKRGEHKVIDVLDLSDLDDLRAALAWAVKAGRFELAVTLLECSAPLWRLLSLVHEHLRRARAVLAQLTASATPRRRDEMRLHAVIAEALPLVETPADQVIAAWNEVYQLANACADSAFRERAIIALIACCNEAGDAGRAAELKAVHEGMIQAGSAPPTYRPDDAADAPGVAGNATER
ncbi:winged helix-turn-helix domain-containing protein [Paraburkholderia terricola]|uniref:winged helix-turn-helix domain-containing protein n=1 Tax=Paraburkholderia terricola TaxID=169427 RepID=UPI000DEFE702|nr:winged helix-turn-helix domain-containing protein [Paraburkholderia terricola]AXE96592.1 transcriptional regulator [Paraburkholderia terricola]